MLANNLPETNDFATPDDRLRWISQPPTQGSLQLNTPASRGVWGTISDANFRLGNIDLQVGVIDPDYGIVLLSSVDGRPLEETDRMVLLVVSRSENQEMGWNAAGDSVGRQWGTGPTEVTSFEVALTLPSSAPLQCFALDGRGQRTKQAVVEVDDGHANIRVGPKYQTLWFEIVRDVAANGTIDRS